jgi:polar amino acid transport system substrate-binding protein
MHAKRALSIARFRSFLVAAATSLITGCAGAPQPPSPQVLAELAPTGKLRTAHIVANPVLVTRDPASGQLRGITIDLAQALAREAGVPLEPLPYESVSALFEGLSRGEIDVLFLAHDPTRASQVDFASTYMEVVNTYLVPANSSIRSVADADRPGVRIAVPAKNAADLYLTRTLKSAQLLRGPTGVAYLTEMMHSGKADAAAGNHLELLQVASKVPGMRIIDGRYTAIPHATAVPKGRPAALAFVRDFSEKMKASGVVQEAITRSGVPGVTVAPPAR